MQRYFFMSLLLFVFPGDTGAQSPENTISLYGSILPAEKIHLHFDKQSYLPGETIWFKAYVMEEYLPSTKSTTLYVSLFDENGQVKQQKIFPILNSTADGYFEIPDTIRSSQLICRAFTSWMLNFDDRLLYTRSIPVYQSTVKTDTAVKTTDLVFFPEGGDVLEGERNTIAFKANYNNGLPFDLYGLLKNLETGAIMDTIRSVHDGMGRFDIIQQPGEHYYIEWMDNRGVTRQSKLPASRSKGVALKMVQQKGKLIYNIVNRMDADSLHVLGYLYQKLIFRTNLYLPPGERYTGSVPLDSFPSGALQLTVFNGNWKPVAERICFINLEKYRLHAGIGYAGVSTARRAKNNIEISLPDTIPANMSLSVTDADLDRGLANNNIITDLLLTGTIRGYVYNPAYYFNGDVVSAGQLDLVMLTHGWRRYNWDELLAGPLPKPKFPVDDHLMVYGQVSDEIVSKLKKDEWINLVFKTKDSTTRIFSVKPDEKGLLRLGGLIFYDTAKLYYSFNKEKKYNRQMAFSTDNYTLVQPRTINNSRDFLNPDTTGTQLNNQGRLFSYYLAQNSKPDTGKVKTLQRVLVKSGGWHNWKNDPIIKMDEKYTYGMFRGGATSFSFDVLHDENAWSKLDIFNYLTNKVPGLILTYPKSAARGGSSLGAPRILFYTPKNSGVSIYLDEREIEAIDLETVQLSQVAYVKMIPNFFSTSSGPGGSVLVPAIAIYTKKGDDFDMRRPELTDMGMVKVPGYSPIKEFYSPDYSENPNALGNDSRTTLLWQPYIFSGKNNTRIPITFYNNDFSHRLKIVLEGMNEEGKLIHLERFIE